MLLFLVRPDDARAQLTAIVVLYFAGLAATQLVTGFCRRDGAMLVLGLLDVMVASLLAAVLPSAWYLLLPVQVTIVSFGWVESRKATVILLVTATIAIGVAGAINGVDQWPIFTALFVLASGAVSVNALWSFSDTPLIVVAESLESVRALVWQADLDGTVGEVAGPAIEMVGKPASDIVGQSLYDMLQSNDLNRLPRWPAGLEQNGTVSFVHELESALTARTTLRLVHQEGQPMAVHGVSVDISAAWKAGEPKRRRAALVQQMHDGILLV